MPGVSELGDDMSDKPLHVRVAEALGWTDCRRCGDIAAPWASGWEGRPKNEPYIIGDERAGWRTVPRYDLEWGATGPIIWRNGIGLFSYGKRAKSWSATWYSETKPCGECGRDKEVRVQWPRLDSMSNHCEDPLVAVCHLILELSRAGTLLP